MRAWQRKEVASLEAWVTAVALNQARDGFRRRAAENRAVVRLTSRRSSTSHAGESDTDPRLADVLAALPRRQREVVVLHYYLDLDVDRVADLLSVSEGTVKTCLHRARGSLRAALGEQPDGGEIHARR